MLRSNRSRLRLERLECRDVPSATLVNLTTRGSSGTVNGAIFRQADPLPAGSDTNSFLRIDSRGVERGYNTDARPLQFDEIRNRRHTHSLNLADVPIVTIGGVQYREFMLNINQKRTRPLLSLDELRIYVGGSGNLLGGYNAATRRLAGLNAVYDLDAGGNSWVKLDQRLNGRRGSRDMLLYVPASLFTGGSYVYLFSKFGNHHAANGGFEEWSVGKPTTTTTGSISGVEFHDINADGVRNEGEVTLVGWVIFLDANDNGLLDEGEVSTTTNDEGRYTFSDLATGPNFVYIVREVQQDGWFLMTPLPDAIVLMSGEHRDGIDFGNWFFDSNT